MLDVIAPIDQKRTRIVATIGPATESEEKIAELIAAGMNIARFNTKHNQPDWHRQIIERVRKVARKMKVPVGILLDLQGPEIRITLPKTQMEVKKEAKITLTSEAFSTQDSDIILPPNVVSSLAVGNHLIMDDGACHFVIVDKNDHQLIAKCLYDCVVKTRKTLNTPNVVIDMPALLPRDEEYLDALCQENIDYVALSFVRSPEDIVHLRTVMKSKKLFAGVIAKIENRKAVENLEAIIEAADAVMVARGDLAVEVDFEELIYWQKKIIDLSRKHAKPVITATQMLASMTEKPNPTRAEISDVSHAIYDGTDAVMLSEETTIGKFPVKAVEVQAKIAQFNEKHTHFLAPSQQKSETFSPQLKPILAMLEETSHTIEKLIIVTDELQVIRQLSSLRSKISLLAVTTQLQLSQQLTSSYGVQPIHFFNTNLAQINETELIQILKDAQKLSLGEKVLIIYNLANRKETAINQPLLREVT